MKHSTVSSSATMICANSTYFNFPGCDLSHSPLPLASILSSSQPPSSISPEAERSLSMWDRVAPPCRRAPTHRTHTIVVRTFWLLLLSPHLSCLPPPSPFVVRVFLYGVPRLPPPPTPHRLDVTPPPPSAPAPPPERLTQAFFFLHRFLPLPSSFLLWAITQAGRGAMRGYFGGGHYTVLCGNVLLGAEGKREWINGTGTYIRD